MDPYEEWKFNNLIEIVNYSQCHSGDRRNRYNRRKSLQKLFGGKFAFSIQTKNHTHILKPKRKKKETQNKNRKKTPNKK